MVMPERQSNIGGSGSSLVLANDQRRYWCKVVNNPQHPRVPVNEQQIGRLGYLIGVETCRVALVRIPDELVGWEFRPGSNLESGWAHGSLAVDGVVETHSLDSRASDNNARRHAGFYALYDWLGGSDPQWLVCGEMDGAYYSHDHGHYLPSGPGWSVDSLQQHVDTEFGLPQPPTGLDADELERLAHAIEGASEDQVAAIASTIPAAWPVSDDELGSFVDFVLNRRAPVAERLRSMIPRV